MPQVELSPAEQLSFRDAIQGAFTPAAARELVAGVNRNYDLMIPERSTYPEALLAVIKAAQAESWLVTLSEKAVELRPTDPELITRRDDLRKRAPNRQADPAH